MSSPTPSSADSMLSAMARLNAPHRDAFFAFLTTTIADKNAHIRFLNMMSMLEHMGSRKIMLSQMQGILTQDILKHLAEETRHAFFFKREAEKLSGTKIEGYTDADTMAASAGRFYFGRLDASLSGELPADTHAETAYLWMSLVVELRALWVYNLYQKALNEAASPLSLRGIIAEEDNHLVDMVARLNEIGFATDAALPAACATEKKLFEKLFAALQNEQPMLALAS